MTKSQDLAYRAPSANPQPTSFLRYPAVALNLTAGVLILIGAPLLYVLHFLQMSSQKSLTMKDAYQMVGWMYNQRNGKQPHRRSSKWLSYSKQ